MEKTKEIKNNNEANKPKGRINKTTLDIIYIAMFTAIITVCAQITIPTAIPFTLQTLGIFVAAGMLGAKRSTLSVLVYVLLGVVGVPVFAGFSGGISVLVGPTGGYIVGFIFTAFAAGLICDKFGKKLWVLMLSMAAGLFLCYAFGTAWFVLVYNSKNDTPIGLWAALGMCVVPYLLFDAAKIVVSAILVNRLNKLVRL